MPTRWPVRIAPRHPPSPMPLSCEDVSLPTDRLCSGGQMRRPEHLCWTEVLPGDAVLVQNRMYSPARSRRIAAFTTNGRWFTCRNERFLGHQTYIGKDLSEERCAAR